MALKSRKLRVVYAITRVPGVYYVSENGNQPCFRWPSGMVTVARSTPLPAPQRQVKK